MAKIFFRTMCAVMLGFAIGNVITYGIHPEIKNAALLKSEAAIIEQYQGSSPAGEMDDALGLIADAKAENPTYVDDFVALEKELAGIRTGLEGIDNAQIYGPVMESAGKTLDTFASNHSKPVSNLYTAGIDLLVSAGCGVGWAETKDERE